MYEQEKGPLFGALPSKMNSQKEGQEGKRPIEGQDQCLPLHNKNIPAVLQKNPPSEPKKKE